MSIIEAKGLTLAYGTKKIVEQLDLSIPSNQITVLIGSNGCGKSTILRSLARLIQPKQGEIKLNNQALSAFSSKELARQLAMLPQGPIAPEGLTVKQLVKQGRYPYQSWLQQWTKEDEEMVNRALEVTRMEEFGDRSLDSLSGGQRQRAWIAMTLAQHTPVILLDEPTTYLDMSHQVEILDLLFELNEHEKRTIIMVLHDINLACRYAHHLVAVKGGKVYAQGAPEQLMSEKLIYDVFQMKCNLSTDPIFGTPLVIPHGKGRNILS